MTPTKRTGRPPGRPRVPETKKKVTISFCLSRALADAVAARAAAEGKSVSAWIEAAIRKSL